MSKKIYIAGSSQSFVNLYSDSLDGVNEYLQVPDNNVFSIGVNGLSAGLWIKKTSGVNAYLISKANGGLFEWLFFIVGDQLFIRVYSNNNGAIHIGRRSTVTIPNSAWHHVCFTDDGSNTIGGFRLYLDAVRIDTTNVTSGVFVAPANTISTVQLGGSAIPLTGLSAHEAVWNKGLSQAEVTEWYNKKMGDLRTVSFAANLTEAYKFINGTADYPTKTGYANGLNATMQNQESSDIITDVPT